MLYNWCMCLHQCPIRLVRLLGEELLSLSFSFFSDAELMLYASVAKCDQMGSMTWPAHHCRGEAVIKKRKQAGSLGGQQCGKTPV